MTARLNRSLLALALLATTAFSYTRVVALKQRPDAASLRQQESLYLPNGKGLEFISFGFKNLWSDLLWFNAINYFGKHYRSDRDYTWLDHMCDLITTLDAQARHVYEFCSLMLAWEAAQPDRAAAILGKALRADPGYWRYYYLRGITYALFLHQEEAARQDFVTGSKLPGAPLFIARLASRKLALNNPQLALEFLKEMISTATNENQRSALMDRYQKIQREFKTTAPQPISAPPGQS